MSAYVLTPLAKADIFGIWAYIAENNESAADRVEEAIYDACAFVAEAPQRGHIRPDLTQRPLRFWTLARYPNYTVVYRPTPTPGLRGGRIRSRKRGERCNRIGVAAQPPVW